MKIGTVGGEELAVEKAESEASDEAKAEENWTAHYVDHLPFDRLDQICVYVNGEER